MAVSVDDAARPRPLAPNACVSVAGARGRSGRLIAFLVFSGLAVALYFSCAEKVWAASLDPPSLPVLVSGPAAAEEETPAAVHPAPAVAKQAVDVAADSFPAAVGASSAPSPKNTSKRGGPWFADPVVDPPGFPAVARAYEAMMREPVNGNTTWVVFAGVSGGIGNSLLALLSSVLFALTTGRRFAYAGNRRFCTWMDSPFCEWSETLPSDLRQLIRAAVHLDKPKKGTGYQPGWVQSEMRKRVKKLYFHPTSCKNSFNCCKAYRTVACASSTLLGAEVVLVMAGNWFAKAVQLHPDFPRAAFVRELPSGRSVVDVTGPLARWLLRPAPAVWKEVERYAKEIRGDVDAVVCIQGRRDDQRELDAAGKCLDDMQKQPWWPERWAIHVVSMYDTFRKLAKSRYGERAHWLGPASNKQMDDVQAYADLMLAGRACEIFLAGVGGSTFSYMGTAHYHNVAVRDVKTLDCARLNELPYEKLYPEARAQVPKFCFETDPEGHAPVSCDYRPPKDADWIQSLNKKRGYR